MNSKSLTSARRRYWIALFLSYAMLSMQLMPAAAAAARTAAPRAVVSTAAESGDAGHAPVTTPVAAAPAPVALAAPPSSNITATMTDAVVPGSGNDLDGDGRADPGDKIQYTVTITNNGPDDATNVEFSDTVDANTTLVPGSITTQPLASPDSYDVIGNVRIQPDAAAGLLTNDCDPATDGGPCTNAGLTASGPTSSTQGGNVTVNSNGSFSYNPPAGFSGTDTFTYTVTDSSGKTDTAQVTLNVGGAVIWFVKAGAPGGGDGRLTSPFNCLVGTGCFDPVAADEAGDFIFLFAGSYNGGLTLLDNEKLIGEGSTDSLATLASVTPATYSDSLPTTGGTPPVITTTSLSTNGVNVGSGNTLRGFTVGDTTAIDIASGASFGTLTVSEVTLGGAGQALGLLNGTLSASFLSIGSTSGSHGLFLNQVAGSLTSGSTTVSGPSQGIVITNSTGNFSFGNTSVSAATAGISVTSSSGTKTFGTLA
ncbi:MAG TPA: Ig-like domain-containing protein, partial [Pyrinomonadaceae bacterium]|nr:Ig-like domain-containing protein [Pyrinomonadaceae bacterium]